MSRCNSRVKPMMVLRVIKIVVMLDRWATSIRNTGNHFPDLVEDSRCHDLWALL